MYPNNNTANIICESLLIREKFKFNNLHLRQLILAVNYVLIKMCDLQKIDPYMTSTCLQSTNDYIILRLTFTYCTSSPLANKCAFWLVASTDSKSFYCWPLLQAGLVVLSQHAIAYYWHCRLIIISLGCLLIGWKLLYRIVSYRIVSYCIVILTKFGSQIAVQVIQL